MRLRRIPGAEKAAADSRFVVQKPEEMKGQWSSNVFGNDHPIHIEIGMGKGQFLTRMASANPGINYIGIERYSSVLLRALEKQEELQLPNLYFLLFDAGMLPEIFAKAEVSRIYLNFSDPWPKARHEKRRLTSANFLDKYRQLLSEDAVVEFKTDNQELFAFSLQEAESSGWDIRVNTKDLHHDPVLSEGNVMTEYEEKFSGSGKPICKMVIACCHEKEPRVIG